MTNADKIESLKRIAIRANERRDDVTLNHAIAILDEIWDDNAAAFRFYTMLELRGGDRD